jgi:hypothetical protein
LRTFDKTREKPTVAGRFEDARPVRCPLPAPCSPLFCITSGAKLRQFRPTVTFQPVSHKQLARARWSEIRRLSHHVKKEKIQ